MSETPRGRGRPLKFETPDELENYNDGEYLFSGDKFIFEDFVREKDLVDYVCVNIGEFTRSYLQDEVVSFEVDKPISRQLNRSPRGRRVDIFIQGVEKKYIIEAKNAKNTNEVRSAIGQLLDYGREYLDPKKELVLISNMFDINTAKTIEFYNLPIRYIVFSKTKTLEFYGTGN